MQWIDAALSHPLNFAAITQAGNVAGHCFLAGDLPGSGEAALFVHQAFRRRGIGTALLRALLESSAAAGLRRIWTLTASDNPVAIRLQERLGFRRTASYSREVELEIELPVAVHSEPN